MSDHEKVVMKLPADRYHNEPEEWLSSFAFDDYIDRRIKIGFSYHFPDLYTSKENKASGLSLYKMNGGNVDNYNNSFGIFLSRV